MGWDELPQLALDRLRIPRRPRRPHRRSSRRECESTAVDNVPSSVSSSSSPPVDVGRSSLHSPRSTTARTSRCMTSAAPSRMASIAPPPPDDRFDLLPPLPPAATAIVVASSVAHCGDMARRTTSPVDDNIPTANGPSLSSRGTIVDRIPLRRTRHRVCHPPRRCHMRSSSSSQSPSLSSSSLSSSSLSFPNKSNANVSFDAARRSPPHVDC